MSANENKIKTDYELSMERSLALILAFMSLDITKMNIRDQLSMPIMFIDIAEMVEPYVKKYGGSVEEITANYKKQQAENKMKDYLAAMMIRNIKKGTEEKKDEQDS
jgi:hypothetical protein